MQYKLLITLNLLFCSSTFCMQVALAQRELIIERYTVSANNLQIEANKFVKAQGLEQTEANVLNEIQQIEKKCFYLIAQCKVAIDNAYRAYDVTKDVSYEHATTCHSNCVYNNHTLPKGITFGECITIQTACTQLLQESYELTQEEVTQQWKEIETLYRIIDDRTHAYRYDREFIRYDQRLPYFLLSDIETHMLSEMQGDQQNIIELNQDISTFIKQIKNPDTDFKDKFSPDQLNTM